jgi:hypothetical protein
VTRQEHIPVHEVDMEHEEEHVKASHSDHLPHHLPPLELKQHYGSETSESVNASLQLQIIQLQRSVTVQASRLEEIQAAVQAILKYVVPSEAVGARSVLPSVVTGTSSSASSSLPAQAALRGVPLSAVLGGPASQGSHARAELYVLDDDANNNAVPTHASEEGGGHVFFSVALTALSQSRLITEPKAQGSRIKCSLEE